MKVMRPDFPYNKLRKIKHPDFPQALFKLEMSQFVTSYKFGVLYVREGQRNENDMFSNGEDFKVQFLQM
jgi:RAP1 GTPase activating protein 1